MKTYMLKTLVGTAVCWTLAVSPEPAMAAQVEDASEILELFDSSSPNESVISILLYKSLDARSLSRGDEQKVLLRIVQLISDDDRDARWMALNLAFVFGVRRPESTARIVNAVESSGYPVMVLSLLDGSHRFSDDQVMLGFFARVARRADAGIVAERAVNKLFRRGTAGRARLAQLDREGLIIDQRAKRFVERMKREGRLGG